MAYPVCHELARLGIILLIDILPTLKSWSAYDLTKGCGGFLRILLNLHRDIMSRAPAQTRDAFAHFHRIETRWKDNDVFAHVNNVVYYSYFDTAVTAFLIKQGVLELQKSKLVGLVAETHCRFISSMAFPDTVYVGMRLGKLGNSSIRYEIGIFKNDDQQASAQGYFVHVYVDLATNKAVPVPESLVKAADLLRVPGLGVVEH